MIGSWLLSPESDHLRILAESELDFAVIDYEHGSGSLSLAARSVSYLQAHRKQVILRVGEVRKLSFQQASDSAPDYIQVAGLDTIKDAQRCIELFEQLGFSPWTRSGRGKFAKPQVILQIENRELLDWALSEELKTSSVTNLFLGRYDLARNVGHTSLVTDEHYEVVELFSKACVQNGLTAWTVCHNRQDFLEIRTRGKFAGISHGSDNFFYSESLVELMKWER
jgi:2-keto-3-deoxy-L-rhamnonate aldolase RhmA